MVIPIGPSKEHLEGAADLVDSLATYEAGPARCVLIDDVTGGRHLEACLPLPEDWDVVTLVNPRLGRGDPRRGGLCAGVLSALREIWERGPVEFVLKLDTDALAIGPFCRDIEAALAADPDIGMLGTLGRTCNRGAPDYGWEASHEPRFLKFLPFIPEGTPRGGAPDGVWTLPGIGTVSREQLRALQVIRPHIARAAANGYRTLEYCQGGAYAVAYPLLCRLGALGYLDDPLVWCSLPADEDVMMGMYARAASYRIVDLSADHQTFGNSWIGLPYPPAELIERGYQLIHSVRNDASGTEAEVRSCFLERRRQCRRAPL